MYVFEHFNHKLSRIILSSAAVRSTKVHINIYLAQCHTFLLDITLVNGTSSTPESYLLFCFDIIGFSPVLQFCQYVPHIQLRCHIQQAYSSIVTGIPFISLLIGWRCNTCISLFRELTIQIYLCVQFC